MPHDHEHPHAGHTHASGDCACSAPANDDFSDEEEIDLFSLYTPLRILDELPASYGVGLRYLIEWEDLPLGAVSVESANGLGRGSKRLLEEWEVRKGEIARGEREAFDQNEWRSQVKLWNGITRANQLRAIEGLREHRLETKS